MVGMRFPVYIPRYATGRHLSYIAHLFFQLHLVFPISCAFCHTIIIKWIVFPQSFHFFTARSQKVFITKLCSYQKTSKVNLCTSAFYSLNQFILIPTPKNSQTNVKSVVKIYVQTIWSLTLRFRCQNLSFHYKNHSQ